MSTRVSARAALTASLHLLVLCAGAHAQTGGRPPVRVALQPVMVEELSGMAWNALFEETRQIWRREGVEVSRSGARDGALPDVTLPLVFSDRELRTHDSPRHDALGVTVFAGREQRILVSISRARDVSSTRHGLADSNDATSLDIALGLVLGRIIAHEIGHALLLTTAHSLRGLMSPHLRARDATGPQPDSQFALSAAERDRLAVRFSTADDPVRRADASLTAAAAAPRLAAAVEITSTDVPRRVPVLFQPRAPR